ncbi:MAG: uroporphyrinogen-III C-methyltransferase [Phycisphaerae bacterium]
MPTYPKVLLVGAGPGDPGLITVAGKDAITNCSVIIYDALANPDLLRYAPSDAERIYAGKQANCHTLTQDEINKLLVKKWHEQADRAAAKLPFGDVVRLKGGDPYVFGRGGEEGQYLFAHKVPFRVIPGITSGIAGPAYAGIPVTHRDFTSTVTLVTGHQQDANPTAGVNFDALAKLNGTLVFYMGVKTLPVLASKLIAAGLDAQTPAAIIHRATHPDQKTFRGRLEQLCRPDFSAQIAPPAITIIGRVAELGDELDWFEQQPLFGKTVLVTRTRQQAGELTQRLKDLGAQVIEAPTIELVPPSHPSAVTSAINRLSQMDMVIFTSVNGVQATWQYLLDARLDARALPRRVVAVGPSTAAALREIGIIANLMPEEFTSDKLAKSVLQHLGYVAGLKIMLLRAQIARPALRTVLEQGGAIVEDVAIYQTVQPQSLPPEALAAFHSGRIHLITFTSASTAKNLYAMLNPELRQKVCTVPKLSIGPVTTQALEAIGWTINLTEASEHDIPGMIAALESR